MADKQSAEFIAGYAIGALTQAKCSFGLIQNDSTAIRAIEKISEQIESIETFLSGKSND